MSAAQQPTGDGDVGPARSRETANRLALAVGRLNRRMSTGGVGLSHGALSALASLVKLGPLRIVDLGAAERAAAATITRTVAALEREGLVSRAPDPVDRRSFVIEASTAGIEVVQRARSGRAAVMWRLLATVDPTEVDLVVAALPALEALVTVEPDTETPPVGGDTANDLRLHFYEGQDPSS